MNRPLPAPSFTLDPEHVPAREAFDAWLRSKGISDQSYWCKTAWRREELRREFEGEPPLRSMTFIDINALDPNERSADEKLDDDTVADGLRGHWGD